MSYTKTVLDNGLRIITSSMPQVRSVNVSIILGVGSRYELPEESGISHFVEHLLFKGSQRRPSSREIAEAIEGNGGILNGGTDKELTIYWAKVMDSHFELAVDVLADLIRYPKLNNEETERERQVIIEEINMCMDSPQMWVNTIIDDVLWPDQALGKDVAGNKETVLSISSQMIHDYWSSHYNPSKTVISIAGNVQPQETESVISDLLGDWPRTNPNSWFRAIDTQQKPRMLVEHRESEQAHLCLALRGVSSENPDRFVFDLLNVILGEGMSCRLFRELREKKGLAYDISSYVSRYLDSGSLTVYAGVSPNNVEATTEAVLNELATLRDVPVPESELNKAKEMVKGQLVLRMENSKSVSTWYGTQELLLNEIQTVEDVISKIESITCDDLKRIAGQYFTSQGLNLAVIGPSLNESRLDSILKL